MPDVNIHWLIGNIVEDARPAVTAKEHHVASFRVATGHGSGESRSSDYHTVVCWDDMADEANARARKGVRVMVEGASRTRSYEKDGVKRYMTETHARTVRYLSDDEDLPASF